MAGLTSGVGGFVDPAPPAPSLPPHLSDLSLLSKDNTAILDNFGFLQFLQIFFLGDYRLLMSFCPKAAAGLFGLDDEVLPDSRDEHTYLGDEVKNTMVMQVMRRLPILTTIPVVITIVLFVVDIIMLINPMSHRIMSATPLAPTIAPFILTLEDAPVVAAQQKRRKRSIDGAAEHGKNSGRRLTHSLASVRQTLSLALGNQGWGEEGELPAGRDQGEQDGREEEHVEDDERVGEMEEAGSVGKEEEAERVGKEEEVERVGKEEEDDRVGKEELPEYNVAPYTKIEVLVRETIGSFADVLPQMGSCLGAMIGCHVRLAFWGNVCSPFGTIITCSGLVGRSISHLLAVLGRNELIYPI